MKKILQIIAIPFVLQFGASAQTSFPVQVSNNIDFNYVRDVTGFYNVYSLSSANGVVSTWPTLNEGIGLSGWKTAALPSITGSSWKVMANYVATGGRSDIISDLHIFVTGACQISVTVLKQGTALSNGYQTYVKVQKDTSGGEVVFDFSGQPVRIEYGDFFRVAYAVAGTGTVSGVNWSMYFHSVSITDDTHYNAKFHMGVCGDSYCNVQANLEPVYSNKGTSVSGLWTVLCQKYLRDHGIDVFRSNIGQGGSNIGIWTQKAENGLFDRWNPDILYFSCGINEGSSTIIDGTAKDNYLRFVRAYFDTKPSGCFVMLNVAESDIAAKNALVGSGPHASQTFLQAIRAVIQEVYLQIKTERPTADIVLADINPSNTYTQLQTTYFVETTAGGRLHPNATLGQPALAAVINPAVATSAFYNKNKTK